MDTASETNFVGNCRKIRRKTETNNEIKQSLAKSFTYLLGNCLPLSNSILSS